MSVDAEVEYRIEHDTMGEVRVPVSALWRAQTQRAVENFPISGRGLERTQIRALGLLKGACAQVNNDLGLLAPEKADAIIAAAGEIASSGAAYCAAPEARAAVMPGSMTSRHCQP